MARIRSIKPEFPQSQSMGNVSRDARLLFILLWPICDDHGRTRADSRMLASLLFPYDSDVESAAKTTRADVEAWLGELEREKCIERYEVNGSTYLEISNWLMHQKIDKPSKPQFPEPTRALASIREVSSEEGKGEEGKGVEGTGSADAPPPIDPPADEANVAGSKRGTRLPKDWEPNDELRTGMREERLDLNIAIEVKKFRDFWTAKPGKDGLKLDWDATFRNWCRNARSPTGFGGRVEPARHRQELRR